MRLKGHRYNQEYLKERDKLKGEREKRVKNTEIKIARVLVQASSTLDIPEPLNKPSNCKPFRRARIDDDLRLYWWIDEGILVFHDIVDHKQAKRKYKDVHKKG